MAWVKIDDQFSEHPKILQVGPLGVWVHIQALCYCSRYLTDGAVTRYAAEMFCRNGMEKIGIETGRSPGLFVHGVDADEVSWPEMLVKAGMWEETDTGYLIHDYLKYNPSRAQVLAEREAAAKRQLRWRESHPEEAKARRNARRNAVTSHEVTPAVTPTVTAYPNPVPVPESYIQLPPDGPTEQAVTAFFKAHGRPELGEDYFNARQSVGWHSNAGLAITDWPADAKRWIRRQNERLTDNSMNGSQPSETPHVSGRNDARKIREQQLASLQDKRP